MRLLDAGTGSRDVPVGSSAASNGRRPASSATRGGRALVGVDLLRHLLTLAVIFQHMPSRSRYSDAVNGYIQHWTPLVDGAVACFFLVSGFMARPSAGRTTIVRNARRLLIPFLLFSLLYTLFQSAVGKSSIAQGLAQTFTGAGAGPQLYFLPYLFIISTAVGELLRLTADRRPRVWLGGAVVLLFAAFLSLPTASSTGSDPRLLPLYGLAYALGSYWSRFARPAETGALTAVAALGLVALPWTARLWDLAAIVLLFRLALLGSRLVARPMRLPGSGGVYLLHTPILNYAISAVLLKLHVAGLANLYGALALTYVVALAITLIVVRRAPKVRPYLLE